MGEPVHSGRAKPTVPTHPDCHSFAYAQQFFSALRGSIDSNLAEKIVFNLTTMIDGLWMRNALQPTSMPPAEAVAHMEFALDQLFTQTEFSSSERTAAREKSRA